jgi:hypothetical protein|nr:hypothetical protein [Pelagibacteraceae bacterium]
MKRKLALVQNHKIFFKMKTHEFAEKYFKKKDNQIVSKELNEFYEDVATGLRIAKQSPSSQKKVKSTFLFDKKKLKPLIKNIDGVIKKLKDVRFIGSSSIDEEYKALVELKNVASKVTKLPTQPKNFTSQRIVGWVFDLALLYKKYTGKKVWVSNNDYSSSEKWGSGALFIRDALQIIDPKITEQTIHSALRSINKRRG